MWSANEASCGEASCRATDTGSVFPMFRSAKPRIPFLAAQSSISLRPRSLAVVRSNWSRKVQVPWFAGPPVGHWHAMPSVGGWGK